MLLNFVHINFGHHAPHELIHLLGFLFRNKRSDFCHKITVDRLRCGCCGHKVPSWMLEFSKIRRGKYCDQSLALYNLEKEVSLGELVGKQVYAKHSPNQLRG
jgi:hypothetical protein